MADKKISALTSATTPLAGTEVLPIVQGSATVKVSVANLTAGRAVAMAGGSFTDNITQSTAAKGVNFTANAASPGMTSRLLNWYEEGTFTPTASFNLLSVGITYTTQSGVFTRIGNLVSFQCRVTLSSKGSSTGTFRISGLPYANAAGGPNPVSWRVNGLTSSVGDTALSSSISTGSTALELYKIISGFANVLTDTDVTNTSDIMLSGTYRV